MHAMLARTDFDRTVSARLLAFFAAETSWQRRLWDVGACLSLHELVKAVSAVADGTLSQKAAKCQRHHHLLRVVVSCKCVCPITGTAIWKAGSGTCR